MSLALSLLALHLALAAWATIRSSRMARWGGVRLGVAIAFAWLLPWFWPTAVLAATIGSASTAGDPNLRHAVEQLLDAGSTGQRNSLSISFDRRFVA